METTGTCTDHLRSKSLHCTDLNKTEIQYIKNGIWEKPKRNVGGKETCNLLTKYINIKATMF